MKKLFSPLTVRRTAAVLRITAAATLGVENQLPFVDSVIYATGIISNMTIYTQDSRFKNLKGVRFVDTAE